MTYIDELEWTVESFHFDAKYIFNLTGEYMAGSACSETTNQWVSQVDSDKSQFQKSHQNLKLGDDNDWVNVDRSMNRVLCIIVFI